MIYGFEMPHSFAQNIIRTRDDFDGSLLTLKSRTHNWRYSLGFCRCMAFLLHFKIIVWVVSDICLGIKKIMLNQTRPICKCWNTPLFRCNGISYISKSFPHHSLIWRNTFPLLWQDRPSEHGNFSHVLWVMKIDNEIKKKIFIIHPIRVNQHVFTLRHLQINEH